MKNIIKQNIIDLAPYSSARDEFEGEGILMDANESPYGLYNRYPDPYQRELKALLAQQKGVKSDQIFIGNGSDEIIDLLMRMTCTSGKNKVLQCTPTYGMYKVYADINDIEIVSVPLTEEFQLDVNALEQAIQDESVQLLFLCSPNNPTGNLMKVEDVKRVLNQFKGLVIIDEAYIDFSDQVSWVKELNQYDNLAVMQTMSKSYGAAGLRLGMLFANPELINYLNKMKAPYNISAPNQELALAILENEKGMKQRIQSILNERTRVLEALEEMESVLKIYPSDANFILILVEDANTMYDELQSRGVIIRNRNSVVKNALRISIGAPQEDDILLKSLKEISYAKSIVCR